MYSEFGNLVKIIIYVRNINLNTRIANFYMNVQKLKMKY